MHNDFLGDARRRAVALTLAVLVPLSLLVAGCERKPATQSASSAATASSAAASLDLTGMTKDSARKVAFERTKNKVKIKGWIDEQRLMKLNPRRHAGLARIIPMDSLEEVPTASFTSKWLLVARIESESAYVKLNLAPGQSVASNLVELKKGTNGWYARITSSIDSVVYFEVTREDHPGEKIPGTARWVWKEDDETAWIACGDGCCQIGDRISAQTEPN